MEEPLKYLTVVAVTSLLVGCGSAPVFTVVSEPEAATVYVLDAQSGDKKKIGETPIEKEEDALKKEVGTLGKGGEFVELIVEKEGFESKKMLLPLSSSGSLRSSLKVTLKTNEQAEKKLDTVKNILDQLFLAQKFARLKQFERALIEIDKVLSEYPKFARALSMKGSIYFASGEFKSSMEWYDKAIEVDPEFNHAVEMSAKVRKQLKLPPRTPASKTGGP